MRPIDWLLAHLDDSDVTEIVLGLGRPVAVRGSNGFRAITSMDFGRTDIETLVAGTPLSGLIASPVSRPPFEVDIDARRLVVEVVRQGFDAALRIGLAAGAPRTVTPTTPPRTVTPTAPSQPSPSPDPDPPARFKTTIAPRTVTPTAAPQATPVIPARTTTPTAPPEPVAPVVSPRTMTAPRFEAMSPRTTTPPPRTTTPPPLAAPATYEPDFAVAPEDEPDLTLAPEGSAPIHADGSSSLAVGDAELAHVTPGGAGEIDELAGPEGQASYEDYGNAPAEGYAAEWYGPQIIDEQTDISALHALLEAARRRGASDLHVIAQQPVTIRRLGEIAPLDVDALVQPYDRAVHSALFGPLDPTMADRFLLPLLGPSARQKLIEIGYVDIGFLVPGRGRVRGNISRQQDGLAGTFRLARDTIPTLDELGLPKDIAKVVRHHQGLVVIAGPSGHGKTTTMAALVDLLNTANSDHIITIEDPVEIEHPAKKAIVSHREVGRHTLSFVTALKASLREDPDVIVIGELRDRETVEIALTAAETGHLVLATISTPSAVKTIDRLIDMFPPDDQVQVRASISGTLRAVIAQRLLPNAARDGMIAAIELVTGVLPLATMIRDNKLFQLPSLMQRGRAFGMIRLDDSLAEHVRAKRITEIVALGAAENKRDLAAALSPRAAAATPTNVRGLFGPKGQS
jgi:twitching motility protein PilT